jgi:hypothetical protein
MPVTARHHLVEHYTTPEKLGSCLPTGWEIRLTLQTGQFMEAPYLAPQPTPAAWACSWPPVDPPEKTSVAGQRGG